MNENGHFQIDEQTWELLMEKINSIHEDVKATCTQATITNGRVSVLEQWKSFIQGALALAGILVLPALGYVVYTVVTKVH